MNIINCISCKDSYSIHRHHRFPYDKEKETFEIECDACGKTSGQRSTEEEAINYWVVNNLPLEIKKIILEQGSLKYISEIVTAHQRKNEE